MAHRICAMRFSPVALVIAPAATARPGKNSQIIVAFYLGSPREPLSDAVGI